MDEGVYTDLLETAIATDSLGGVMSDGRARGGFWAGAPSDTSVKGRTEPLLPSMRMASFISAICFGTREIRGSDTSRMNAASGKVGMDN